MDKTSGDYAEINGIRMWYAEHGAGDPVVMLHPGGADSRAFGPNLDALSSCFHVYLPERRGHGHTQDGDAEYSYELMADDTIRFLETVVGGPAKLVGMSDGGVVALLTAHKRPDLVAQLVCAGSVFNNKGWLPGVIDPLEEAPEFQAEIHEELSPDGMERLPVVVRKMNAMHAGGPTLTKRQLKRIVIPGTSHGHLVEKPDLCNKIIVDFLTLDPVETYAPIRRAAR